MDDDATLSDGTRDGFEHVIQRFEDAWHGPSRPEIGAYLPTGAGRVALLTELVHVDLEYRLRAGEAGAPSRCTCASGVGTSCAREGPGMAIRQVTPIASTSSALRSGCAD